MNFNPEILGLVAGTLSCITFVPQIFKTWKSKSVKDISVTSFMIVVTSTLIWLVYGIWKELPSVILTNVVVCISAVIMLHLRNVFIDIVSEDRQVFLCMFELHGKLSSLDIKAWNTTQIFSQTKCR